LGCITQVIPVRSFYSIYLAVMWQADVYGMNMNLSCIFL
jgi:hypothetical protein